MKIFDINNTVIRQQNLINLNVKLGRSGVRYLSTKNNDFGIEKIKWLKTLRKWSQNDCYGTDHHRPHYLTEKGFYNILSVIKNPWTVSVLTANAIAFNIYQKFKTNKENIVFENDVRKKLAENPTSALKKRTGINLQPKTLITPTDYELLQKGKINDSNSKFNRKIVILQKRKAKKERLSNRKNVMNDFIDNSEKNVITCQHTKPSFTLNKFLMQHTFRAITPGSSIFFASNNCSSFTNNKSPEKDISDTDAIVKKSIHKKRTSKRIRRVQRKNVQLKSSKRKLLRPLCGSNGNTQLNFETKRQDVNNIKKREIKSWKYFDSPSKLEGNKAEIFKFDELSQQCTTSEPLQPPPPAPSKPNEPKTTPPTKPPSKEHDDPWAPPIRKSSSNTNLTHMQKLQCLYDRFCTTFKSSFLQSCNTLKTSFQNLVSAPKHHVQNDKLNNKRFSSKTKVEKVSVIRPHKLKKTNRNNISWKRIERSNISSATDVIKQSAKYMTTATKIHNQTLWLNLCAFLKANPKPNEIENLLTHTPLHNGDGNQGISRYSISKLIPRKTTFNNKKGCFSSSRRRWNHQTPNSGIVNEDHAKPKCLIMKEDPVHDVSKSNQQFLKHNFGQKLPNIQIDNDKVFAIKSYKLNNPKLSSTININKSNFLVFVFTANN
ncbi:hypothetical protein FQR65_LT00467 [Abscondita terminalis]|nr:hypothetical protein FQR65_LT00467 [Abscondita terminalis]